MCFSFPKEAIKVVIEMDAGMLTLSHCMLLRPTGRKEGRKKAHLTNKSMQQMAKVILNQFRPAAKSYFVPAALQAQGRLLHYTPHQLAQMRPSLCWQQSGRLQAFRGIPRIIGQSGLVQLFTIWLQLVMFHPLMALPTATQRLRVLTAKV